MFLVNTQKVYTLHGRKRDSALRSTKGRIIIRFNSYRNFIAGFLFCGRRSAPTFHVGIIGKADFFCCANTFAIRIEKNFFKSSFQQIGVITDIYFSAGKAGEVSYRMLLRLKVASCLIVRGAFTRNFSLNRERSVGKVIDSACAKKQSSGDMPSAECGFSL